MDAALPVPRFRTAPPSWKHAAKAPDPPPPPPAELQLLLAGTGRADVLWCLAEREERAWGRLDTVIAQVVAGLCSPLRPHTSARREAVCSPRAEARPLPAQQDHDAPFWPATGRPLVVVVRKTGGSVAALVGCTFGPDLSVRTVGDGGKAAACGVTEQWQLRQLNGTVVLDERQLLQAADCVSLGGRMCLVFLKVERQVQPELADAVPQGQARRKMLVGLADGIKQEQERLAKERLRLLRQGDDKGYRELLMQARQDKYVDLVEQTDAMLRRLGMRIVRETTGPAPAGENAAVMQLEGKVEGYDYALEGKVQTVEQPRLLQGGALKRYQIEAVQWLMHIHRNGLSGILADEMGLGKTVMTLALLCQLEQEEGRRGKHLIVAPLSTLDNWVSEASLWTPHLRVLKFQGSAEKREALEETVGRGDFDVMVTQYQYLQDERLRSAYGCLLRVDWDYVVVDEGHRLKNPKSKFSTRMRGLKSRHRLLLTGTPLQNDINELWALLNFLMPTVFDHTVDFSDWGIGDSRAEMSEEERLLITRRLHRVLRPFMLRREKKDVLVDFPKRTEHVVRAPLSGLQQRLYNQILEHGFVAFQDDSSASAAPDCPSGLSIERLHGTKQFMALRKLCLHPFLLWEHYGSTWDRPGGGMESMFHGLLARASGKFDILNRMLHKLRATGHKTLVFSQFTTLLDILEYLFESNGWERGQHYERLDGGCDTDERKRAMHHFQTDSDCFVFVLSTRAGGQGLNLQGADTVVIFDIDWNPQQDLQAMARAHRLGQTRDVRVFFLLTEAPVEQKMMEVAHRKLESEAMTIRAGQYNQKSTEGDREQMIRQIMREAAGASVTTATSDADIDALLARSDEERRIMREVSVVAPMVTAEEMPASFLQAQEDARKVLEKRRAAARGDWDQVLTGKRRSRLRDEEDYNVDGQADSSSSAPASPREKKRRVSIDVPDPRRKRSTSDGAPCAKKPRT